MQQTWLCTKRRKTVLRQDEWPLVLACKVWHSNRVPDNICSKCSACDTYSVDKYKAVNSAVELQGDY